MIFPHLIRLCPSSIYLIFSLSKAKINPLLVLALVLGDSSLIFSLSKAKINPLLVLGGSLMLANQEIGSLAAKLAGRTIRVDDY